ncbi:MAG: hypothetical protein AB7V50_02400 [Vampirovibrionia bacterium]
MLSNIISQTAKYAQDQPAPFLRYTTAAIYLISTAAQSAGIVGNKELPKKEKNFLLLQEIINGALELGTFMTIATGFESLGAKLVDKGLVVGTNLAKNQPGFKKGMAMLFSLVGTIVAFNLVTPLLRNPIIHLIQKITGKKNNTQNEELTKPILPGINIVQKNHLNDINPFSQFESTMKSNHMSFRPKQVTFSSSTLRI